ncbi:hypothetical protein ACFLSA_04860 [Bacteroidota bacterium]
MNTMEFCCQTESTNVLNFYLHALDLRKQEKYSEAIDLNKEILNRYPYFFQSYIELIEIYGRNLKDKRKANELYNIGYNLARKKGCSYIFDELEAIVGVL